MWRSNTSLNSSSDSNDLAARRVAAELMPGQVVNLSAGLPGTVPGYVPAHRGVVFHAENGVLGYGPTTGHGTGDRDLVDAGGQPINLLPGSVIVDQADSFGLVRGGYIDVGVVEAAQVSEKGDLVVRMASQPGPFPPVGASDVAAGARFLVAMMEHTTRDGAPRIVKECSHPTAGMECVDLIVTDLAVVQVTRDGLLLKEIAPGRTVAEVQEATEATLIPATDVKEMELSSAEGKSTDKVYLSPGLAVADIPDGAVLLLDGFAGPGGMAQYLLLALRERGAKDLTIVSNTAGIARVTSFGTPPGFRTIDHSILVDNGQVRKAVASFPVSPSPSRPTSFELAYKRGDAELELVPQGTLAERIRAGGYAITAFYTPTGAGTMIADGKETRMIDGRQYVLEYGIKGDFALIRAQKADRMGNLVYKGTSRNFNAVMAPAAAITIAEVDEIVDVGELDPDAVVTPGVFVQRIVCRPADFSPYEALT